MLFGTIFVKKDKIKLWNCYNFHWINASFPVKAQLRLFASDLSSLFANHRIQTEVKIRGPNQGLGPIPASKKWGSGTDPSVQKIMLWDQFQFSHAFIRGSNMSCEWPLIPIDWNEYNMICNRLKYQKILYLSFIQGQCWSWEGLC